MALPIVTESDIGTLVPGVTAVGHPQKGGQKLVFPCTVSGVRCAIKVMLASPEPKDQGPNDGSEAFFDEVAERARREVAIIGQCDCPSLIKLGPIGLTRASLGAQSLVLFSEEWIDGRDLGRIIHEDGALSLGELIRLGNDVTNAIAALWSLQKVHRDIKPNNIMRRNGTGDFVLLDMGFALDLADQSLTSYGFIPGTQRYFSPEQTDLVRKRLLDFRSDLFQLGIVLYEAATRQHPFWRPGMTTLEATQAMLGSNPLSPKHYRPEIPAALEQIIVRLLAKKPHLRYRNCDVLCQALSSVNV